MAKKRQKQGGMVDPAKLGAVDKHDDKLLVVIIETPKGSRNKYAYDVKERIFELKKVLPAGMAFPYDFGFVPSTIGGDGDPLDVLVLMDEPAFTGCKLKCRVIGIIEGEQSEGGKKERNDRLIAVERDNHSYARIKHFKDLGDRFCKELEEFFVNYHQLDGKTFKVSAVKGPAAGWRAVKKARSRV